MKDVNNVPELKYPGQVGEQYLSREMLEKFYQPWIDIKNKGVGVHCGECGCWNKTPHNIFLAWFGDVLDILTTNNIGYALVGIRRVVWNPQLRKSGRRLRRLVWTEVR